MVIENHTQSQNTLYPIFLRLDRLRMLIVGAGEVGHEKLSFILKSSPDANITMVATWMGDGVHELLAEHPGKIQFIKRAFDENDVIDFDIVIAATNINEVNRKVHCAAKRYGKVVNVADTPSLCDFYMGSIVTRGDLKIGVSTNGKSPTFAKRFRQLLEEILPVESHNLVNNLKVLRDRLKGDFDYKVKELNRLTKSLVEHE